MAFRNQPLAGNYLVRAAIQSINYVQGLTGWTINRDGSAEFNSVTIRGATTSQGVSLYYNGAPANGNMIASIAPAAGTDAYGNAYPQGIATYNGAGVRTGLWNMGTFATIDPVSLGFAEIVPLNTTNFSPSLIFSAGGNSTYKGASVGVQTDTTDTNQPLEILTLAGASSLADAHRSYAAIQMYAGGTSLDGAKAYLEWYNNSTAYVPFLWNQNGIVGIGSVYAAQPGTVPAAQEAWHTTSLAASWTASGGAPCSYRLMADGTVVMKGFMTFAGTLTSGSTITGTALPAGYRPLQTYVVPCVLGGNVTGQIQVNTNGSVQIFLTASLVNPTLVWDAVRFPVI
ncbi:MAG: hypothetical protein HOY79_49765 [Streptomyces sp.]|nr:hypothetical protein [Streptomyces sp.]